MNKSIQLLMLIFVISGTLRAQKKDVKSFFKFNEAKLSINQNESLEEPLGFGLGAYKVRDKNRYISYVWGLEYNKSSKERDAVFLGNAGSLTDVTYTFHNLLVPMGYRLHLGHKYKFVVSANIFLDLALDINYEGTQHIINLDPNGGGNSTTQVSGNATATTLAIGYSYGAGFSLPVYKNELIFQLNHVYSFRDVGEEKDTVRNSYYRFWIGYRWMV